MEKRFLLIALLLFFVPFSSAKIIFESPLNELYNLGDNIEVNLSIEKAVASEDYLNVFLDCDKDVLIIYKKYHKIEPNKKYFLVFEFPVSLEGECKIRASFDNEIVESQKFEVSHEINVDFEVNSMFFLPNEKIIVNGTAIKENGEGVDGVAVIYSEGLFNRTINVEDGKFFSEFLIKKDAYPKKYKLKIKVIEKNGGETGNYGEALREIEIGSLASNIIVECNESIVPPKNLKIKAKLLDQAGNLIKNESIILKLFSPDMDKIVFDKVLKSDEEMGYFFEGNSTKGCWHLMAYYGNLYQKKEICIGEHKEVKFSLVNATDGSYVFIENIGNVPYEGVIGVVLKNSSFLQEIFINISLDVGRNMKYPLYFSGEYNVSIDGEEFKDIHLYGLSGAAVYPTANFTKFKIYIFCFAFLLLILFGVIYFIYKKKGRLLFKKKKFSSKSSKEEKRKKAFLVFFKFSKYKENFEELIRKKGFSLNKVNDNFYFVLFYAYPEESVYKSLIELAMLLRKKVEREGEKVSIVINCRNFEGKISSLMRFSWKTKKILEFSEGIVVCEEIFKRLHLKERKEKIFKFKDGKVKMYELHG